MVERAAQAAYAWMARHRALVPWESASDNDRTAAIDQVSVIIAAIREPTDVMLAAGIAAYDRDETVSDALRTEPSNLTRSREVWRAMIDTALLK